jgi:succinate dehydrogenase / fumarate reductase, cytochrome b subunit
MAGVTGLFGSTVGKKYIVAITGFLLFVFVVLHVAGNLLVFFGEARMNAYAALTRLSPGVLWGARTALLLLAVLHVVFAIQLWVRNRRERPAYEERRWRETDPASRSMIITGLFIATFVTYHILHLTTGTVHANFDEANVYRNVITGFQSWPVATVYVIANVLLGFHLYHGVWSTFQTLGLNHPRYNLIRRAIAATFAVAVPAGFISIPVAIQAGWIG